MPTPTGQNLANWRRSFTAQVGALTPDTILIAHSIGCAFALRLLEQSLIPIAGCYLVAGFAQPLVSTQFDPLNESFLTGSFNFAQIIQQATQFHIYASDNDPYVPTALSQTMCQQLNGQFHLMPGAGHFNAAAGYLNFPQLLANIRADWQSS